MTPAPIKPAVSLDVVNQIDIRVGTILAVADGTLGREQFSAWVASHLQPIVS